MGRRVTDPRASGIGAIYPGKAIVSIEELGEAACVTGYANIAKVEGAGTVRLNLMAAMNGTYALLASAFVAPGFSGIWASVTGFCADSFHVWAQALSSTQVISVGLISAECCAAPTVQVPASLQQAPPDVPTDSPLYQPPPAPMQNATGRLTLQSLDDPGGADSIVLAPGSRIVSMTMGGTNGAGECRMLWPNGKEAMIYTRNLDSAFAFFAGVEAGGVIFDTFSGGLQSINVWTVS